MERDLGAAVELEHRDVVDLAHARHAIAAAWTRSRSASSHPRLDVDDDVLLGQRAVYRRLDGVGPA